MINGKIRLVISCSCIVLAACGSSRKTPTASQNFVRETINKNQMLPANEEERKNAAKLSPLERAKFWGTEYKKNPGNPNAAIAFAQSLRAIDSHEKAAEIAANALMLKPADPILSEIYASAALARGRPDLAASALLQAEPNFKKQWKLYSLLGIAFDQTGQHEKARSRYHKALKLMPEHPSILTNLALSHALSGNPEKAENILRTAANKPNANMEVRQNFALILGIQGKFEEAAQISAHDLTPEQIKKNISWFRSMLSPGRQWKGMQQYEKDG